MLSSTTIEIIKSITPLVAEHAETLTRKFYELLFKNNPEVAEYFNPANQATGVQQRALANAICAYFTNIDNLQALGPAVQLIAHKHCSLGVQPEHYPVVGKNLLQAVTEIMGDAATPEIVMAIAEAYKELAEIFISVESSIYQEQSSAPGGWNGYRQFSIVKRVPEALNIESFYLKPVDDNPIPTHQPGQYITIRDNRLPRNVGPRNYSLSDCPNGEYFRISVKKESASSPSCPHGVTSNHIHKHLNVGDIIDVGAPCGNFTLLPTENSTEPIYFIAAGVGITPLLAMVKQAIKSGVSNPMTLIHVVRNRESLPFHSELTELTTNPRFQYHTVFSQDSQETSDDARRTFVVERVTEIGKQAGNFKEACYYVCGPKSFMQSVIASLVASGVDKNKIAFEFFGPLESTEKPTQSAGLNHCPFH